MSHKRSCGKVQVGNKIKVRLVGKELLGKTNRIHG